MNKGNRGKIALYIGGATLGTTLISIYIGAAAFFANHFYLNSSINGMNIGGKTINGVKALEKNKGTHYVLKIEGREGKMAEIRGEEIELHYAYHGAISPLKANENPFAWPMSLVAPNEYKIKEEATYNEELLNKAIDNIIFLNEENIVAPENARLEYQAGEYKIVEGEEGNVVNKEILHQSIVEAIENRSSKLNLEEKACYEQADFTAETPAVGQAKEVFDEYIQAEMTYCFGEDKEVIDANLIKEWLYVDEDYNPRIDEQKIAEYIDVLGEKYNTLGQTRKFITSSGKEVEVTGGDYGWAINKSEELPLLINMIKEGEKQEREPIAILGSSSYGESKIGDSYVEISLTNQYLWFYKEGRLITEGSVVTGDRSRNYSTPQGTYKLDYKQRNAVLRGPGYATPVSFWMPFNRGIGIHDATWRGSFGGNIYVYNGSHGCVNVPYNMAQAIFNGIETGMPIVCYYE